MTYRTDSEVHYDDPATLAALRAAGWRFESPDAIPHGFDPDLEQVVVFGLASGTWRRYTVVPWADLNVTVRGLRQGGWTELTWDYVDSNTWTGKSLCEQNGDLFCASHRDVADWPRVERRRPRLLGRRRR